MKLISGVFAVVVLIGISGCNSDGGSAPQVDPLSEYVRSKPARRVNMLMARSAEAVCDRWNQDYPSLSTHVFTAGVEACDPGSTDLVAQEDAIRRLNLYRWLAGMDAVTLNQENSALAQAAAVIMHANRRLSHTPDRSWACWTPEGEEGATSNLALGIDHPADAIDGYMIDYGDNNRAVGHRRWFLLPNLADVGVGHHGIGNAVWVRGRSNTRNVPEFVGHPAPGFYPLQGIQKTERWSLSIPGELPEGAIVSARVTRPNGAVVSGGYVGQKGAGQDAVVIDVPGPIREGKYKVEVQTSECVYSYETTIVDCEDPDSLVGLGRASAVSIRCK
jgi:hypothetical protein